MKMLKVISAMLVVMTAVFVGISFMLPSRWSVERSIVVHSTSARIYTLVANLKSGWPRWSAFDAEDPSIQYRYSGPDEGVGATRFWISKKMGDGSQKIVKADAAAGIEFELVMEQNQFRIDGKIAFSAVNDSTKVTWTDSGTVGLNPIHRYMVLFLDSMMGPAFERSLMSLKQKAEE